MWFTHGFSDIFRGLKVFVKTHGNNKNTGLRDYTLDARTSPSRSHDPHLQQLSSYQTTEIPP